jgi:arginyl-tRNA synthetase
VYYVQYAHARIASILRTVEEQGGTPQASLPPAVVGPHERALLRAVARYPVVIAECVERRAPHRLHAYLGELAAEFHLFYKHCRVLSDDAAATALRVGLCRATKSTLAGARTHVDRPAVSRRQAENLSRTMARSSSSSSGVRSRSRSSRCETARLR